MFKMNLFEEENFPSEAEYLTFVLFLNLHIYIYHVLGFIRVWLNV